MDNRQTEIREGAGLHESRLNVEFIEWLRRYSTPILIVLAAIALAYFGWMRMGQLRESRLDDAFYQLSSAIEAGSPEALLAVASEHEGRAAVPHLARLAAGDVYLRAARTGLRPGAAVNAEGLPEDESDLLSEAEIERMLDQAEQAYRAVVTRTREDRRKAMHTINGLFGLAAVAESRADFEAAREHLTRLAELADRVGLRGHASQARHMIETIDDYRDEVRLYARAELPERPADDPDQWRLDLEDQVPELIDDPAGLGLPPDPGGETFPDIDPGSGGDGGDAGGGGDGDGRDGPRRDP